MNIEICKNCPRKHCWLCFDFGELTIYEKLFGMDEKRKAVITTVRGHLDYDTKNEAHLVLEQDNGKFSISKYMDRWSSFFDWDECIKYGYPFYRFMEEGILKKGDKCPCYAEHLVCDLNKDKSDET